MNNNFDVAIVGLGPCGLKFLNLAIAKGLNIVCFETENLGGVCLNRGCIPTKSFLHDSKNLDFQSAKERKNKIVETFRNAISRTIKASGVTFVNSKAEIIDKNTILANSTEYKADKIIFAGGSVDIEIPTLKVDHNFILNSDDIFNLEEMPKNIVIVGSGAIGVEWARILKNYGVEVSIVEKALNILPSMDIDVSKRMERILKTSGIKYFKDNEIVEVGENSAILKTGEKIETDKILVAIGKKPNKIEVEGVYSIGDANPVLMLAHSAEAQAEKLFCELFGKKSEAILKTQIPAVIYGVPEVASIGLREQDLENKEDYKIYNYPLLKLAKAHCDNHIEGFIKIIANNENKIVGAHIISLEASSLISIIATVMHFRGTIEDIKEIIFPHPTLAEAIKLSLE
ncbi:NAD(P)/FAD-dependent oxidoreductase [bacterium]|nr:NAD(P)/FAD-dependent oxidoreductase [bacterium]